MVSLVNSQTNATRIGWHLWEIDLRSAPGLPPGWNLTSFDYLLRFFFFTLVTGPGRSLSLTLSDTRVYEPQIQESMSLKYEPAPEQLRFRDGAFALFRLFVSTEEEEKDSDTEGTLHRARSMHGTCPRLIVSCDSSSLLSLQVLESP